MSFISKLLTSRAFSSIIKGYKPSQRVEFDPHGYMLIYHTASASTFLKFYAPVNIGFIGIHLYFTVAELLNPLVPGLYAHLLMTSGLTAVGIGIACMVEISSRRFIKALHLKDDGKTLLITFHSAFTTKTFSQTLDIRALRALEMTSQGNYRLERDGKYLFFNLQRNEETSELSSEILAEVLKGSYINTISEASKIKSQKQIS